MWDRGVWSAGMRLTPRAWELAGTDLVNHVVIYTPADRRIVKNMSLSHSGVPIIDYNWSLIENLKRRNNQLWKMFKKYCWQIKILKLVCCHFKGLMQYYNRWSIGCVNPIIYDDRLWILSLFSTLLSHQQAPLLLPVLHSPKKPCQGPFIMTF